jgi:hypothetical protein
MSRRHLVILIMLIALVLSAVPLGVHAAGKSYMAERFDVEWNLLADGVLDVTETVEFRFEGGPFTFVYRELPEDYSDGISNIQASLDGQPLPVGEGAGQYEVSGSDPVRITWHLPPTSDATHVFELRYWMLGVVRQEADRDLFLWNALPTDYEYPIARSTVRLTYPAGAQPSGPVEVRRGRAEVTEADGQIVLTATDLAPETPLTVAVPFASGSLISVPPAWQARDLAAREAMPGVLAGVLAVLGAGLAALYVLWARGRRAVSLPDVPLHASTLPGELPPALAGALTASAGKPTANHALAALFSLAQRGVLSIEETSEKTWYRPHDFVIRQVDPGPRDLRPHEAALLDLVFTTKSGRSDTVKLSELGQRLGSKFSRFSDPLLAELGDARLIDPARHALSRRFMVIGVVFMVAILPLLALAVLLLDRFGPYGFLLAAAMFVLSMVAFILSGTYSPLSDEGAREAVHWQGFANYLKDVTTGREPAWDLRLFDRYLPYAATFGLAGGWAKAFQKRGNAEIPGWFHGLAGSSDGSMGSFVVMMSAANSTGSSGAGGAGAGGAGGGGGSGAG